MDDYLNMNVIDLEKAIGRQDKQIEDLKNRIDKIRETYKYRKEHLQRLEKKNDALIQEKNQLIDCKQKLSREFALITDNNEQSKNMQIENDKAVISK